MMSPSQFPEGLDYTDTGLRISFWFLPAEFLCECGWTNITVPRRSLKNMQELMAKVMIQSSRAVCLKSVTTTDGRVARGFGTNICLLNKVKVTVGSCFSISAAQLVGDLIRENFPSLGYLSSLGKRAGTKFRLFPTCSPEDNPGAQFWLMQRV